MKFRNEGSPLTLKWNGNEYEVPVGEFNVENEKLGNFITKKTIQWGLSIKDITKEQPAPKIEPVAESEKIDTEKEEESNKAVPTSDVKQEDKEGVKEDIKTKKNK